MIRKLILAAAAVATLGTVSLTATTPAAAWGKGGGFGGFHHHHGFYGGGYRGFRVYAGYDSCLRTRWVVNRYGNLVPRTINVCY